MSLLNSLYEFGQKVTLPSGFTSKPMHFVITIDVDGNFISLEDVFDKEHVKTIVVSSEVRTKNIKPNFLCDSFDFLAACNTDEKKTIELSKLNEKHETFISLHTNCYNHTKNEDIKSILDFYSKNGKEILQQELTKFTNASNICIFRIYKNNGIYVFPHENQELIDWYVSYKQTLKQNSKNVYGQCSITGKQNVPLIAISSKKIPGLPAGKFGGIQWTCNNFNSVSFNGLSQLYSSNISVEADLAIVNALDYLSSNKKHILKKDKRTFIFWTDKTLDDQVDLLSLLECGDNDEKIHDFINDYKINRHSNTNVEDVDAHLIEINGITGRCFMKYYNFTESQMKKCLYRFYTSIENNREDEKYYCSYRSMVKSLTSKSVHKPLIERDLINCILLGKKPTDYTISQIKSQLISNAGPYVTNKNLGENKNKYISNDFMSLINLCLEYNNMNKEDIQNSDAYRLGRFLSLVDQLQFYAIGKTNTCLIRKWYGILSINPNRCFNQIKTKAEIYLSILNRKSPGKFYYFEPIIREIINDAEKLSKAKNIDSLIFAKGFASEQTKRYNKTTTQTEKEEKTNEL